MENSVYSYSEYYTRDYCLLSALETKRENKIMSDFISYLDPVSFKLVLDVQKAESLLSYSA
jgi:hypothetical protein